MKDLDNSKFISVIFKGGLIIWAMGAIASITFAIGVIYVIFHFVSKFW